MSVYVTLWSSFTEPNLISQFHKVEKVYTELVDLMSAYIVTEDHGKVLRFLDTYDLSHDFVKICIRDKQFRLLVETWHRNRYI